MSSKEALLRFAKTLAGHYSNFEQSQDNPKDFAHINIYFRPLPWETLKGPGFYSEQSYDHDPWSPYRQGIHRLQHIQDIVVVEKKDFIIVDARNWYESKIGRFKNAVTPQIKNFREWEKIVNEDL